MFMQPRNKNPNDPNIWLTAYIPVSMKRKLEKIAEKEDRSLSGMIKILLEKELKNFALENEKNK